MSVRLTGIGLVTGFGQGAHRFWNGLLETATLPVHDEPDVGPFPIRGIRYTTPTSPKRLVMLDLALREALADASLEAVPEDALVMRVGQGPEPGSPPNAAAAEMLDMWPWRHPLLPASCEQIHLSHACASAAVAVGFARDWLAADLAEIVVVAGVSALNGYENLGMHVSRALTAGSPLPFDRARSGIVLGDGAGVLILETVPHAAHRGATSDIEVAGAVSRVAAGDASSSDPDVVTDCTLRAVRQADLATGPAGTPYIHAHATGTVQGDAAEIAGLEDLAARMDWDNVPVSSHKGAIGHLMHASAFPAVAAGVYTMRERLAPGTSRLSDPENTHRLHLLADAVPCNARSVLVTSFGFAGNSAALVLTHRPEEQPG
ncbi:beta-ketoacyl synthase N-terminal-like domain-containing protein [Spirillospora sp. NPDC048911]|uniref:beta-ketoacyl synthase N-terminal-like domain-containing protein n=1 Tax=Spirillospora sp. NPDC048911 TaxID=3364527 RepID=UPI00371021D6